MAKRKKQKIRKLKYDFAELKKEYFASEYDEVKGFFQGKLGVYNSHINDKTTGWTEEKKKRKAEIAQKSIEKAQIEEIEENAKALKNLLFGIRLKVGTKEKLDKLSVKDLQRLFEMLMPLNGRPTKYIRNETLNRNLNSDIPLTEEEQEELKQLLKEVGLEK